MNIGGVRIGKPQMGQHTNVYRAAAASYAAALSFGYMIGYSSPAIPDMITSGVTDDEGGSWFGAIATIGALIGSPIAGALVEKCGRKMALLSVSLPFAIGWLVITASSSSVGLNAGRILTGVGSGMTTVVAPLYVSETSSKEVRGTFGSGVQLFVTLGIFLVYSLGALGLSYKALALAGFVIPILAVALTLLVPETPRYYLLKQRKADALRSLAWLRGPGKDVEDELRDIEESLDPEDTMSIKEFLKPELFRPTIVAGGLMLLQQISGINVVMFYTVSIFESAGFKDTGSLATMLVGGVQVVFTIVACVLMDKAGRRVLLLVASAGMAMGCFGMAYYYHAVALMENNTIGWLAMLSVILYIVAFSLGMGPIPMLMMSEIFPVRARGSASALCTICSWGSAFIVTKEFARLQGSIGSANVFLMFGMACVGGIIFIFKLVPETKGKSLEDIELYFLGRAIRGI